MIDYQSLRAAFDAIAALDPALQEQELEAIALTNAPLAAELKLLLNAKAGTTGVGKILSAVQHELEISASAHRVGQSVGSFKIVRLLGAGGMAQVFLAQRDQGGINQAVALKLNYQLSATAQRRFLTESKILAALKHRNIAHFIEAGVSAEGISYVAMEYVEACCEAGDAREDQDEACGEY